MPESLTLALLSEVFTGPAAANRLKARLAEAAARGAGLVVLPELPLNAWSPRAKTPLPQDAEPPGGRRQQMLSEAAAAAKVAVVGGAIIADPARGGRRLGTALVYDASGRQVARYAKVHLPQEPGFWEASHYEPGPDPPAAFRVPGVALALGIQICSDINRPAGAQLLCAQGAELILVPRASEPGTWPRWHLVLRATALTGSAFVVSVNRPAGADETDVPIGGPSMVVDPNGAVLLESQEPLAIVTLPVDAVRTARRAYPGYLSGRPEVYAAGWSSVLERGTKQ